MKRARSQKARAVVLLSGGLDSTVSLALAFEFYRPLAALFFDYNQHASLRERSAARRIARHYGLAFTPVSIPWFGRFSGSLLIRGNPEPPAVAPEYVDAADGPASRAVWIENRNGVFINIAAAYAAVSSRSIVITGFNREEAAAFPDNSAAYLARINASLEFGCRSPVRVESPVIGLGKREIVQEGLRLGIPWNLLWSCYRGGRAMCGVCESCRRLRRAVAGTPAQACVRFEGGER